MRISATLFRIIDKDHPIDIPHDNKKKIENIFDKDKSLTENDSRIHIDIMNYQVSEPLEVRSSAVNIKEHGSVKVNVLPFSCIFTLCAL